MLYRYIQSAVNRISIGGRRWNSCGWLGFMDNSLVRRFYVIDIKGIYLAEFWENDCFVILQYMNLQYITNFLGHFHSPPTTIN